MKPSRNTSSAYDLSAYDELSNVKRLPMKLNKVNGAKLQVLAAMATPKSVFIFFIAIAAVCVMVYNNAILSEVTDEINKCKEELKTLHSDSVKMQSQIGSSMSDREIAQIAEYKLGLKRKDKYQTEYVYLYQEDKIIVSAPEPESGTILGMTPSAMLGAAMEFFSK